MLAMVHQNVVYSLANDTLAAVAITFIVFTHVDSVAVRGCRCRLVLDCLGLPFVVSTVYVIWAESFPDFDELVVDIFAALGESFRLMNHASGS